MYWLPHYLWHQTNSPREVFNHSRLQWRALPLNESIPEWLSFCFISTWHFTLRWAIHWLSCCWTESCTDFYMLSDLTCQEYYNCTKKDKSHRMIAHLWEPRTLVKVISCLCIISVAEPDSIANLRSHSVYYRPPVLHCSFVDLADQWY